MASALLRGLHAGLACARPSLPQVGPPACCLCQRSAPCRSDPHEGAPRCCLLLRLGLRVNEAVAQLPFAVVLVIGGVLPRQARLVVHKGAPARAGLRPAEQRASGSREQPCCSAACVVPGCWTRSQLPVHSRCREDAAAARIGCRGAGQAQRCGAPAACLGQLLRQCLRPRTPGVLIRSPALGARRPGTRPAQPLQRPARRRLPARVLLQHQLTSGRLSELRLAGFLQAAPLVGCLAHRKQLSSATAVWGPADGLEAVLRSQSSRPFLHMPGQGGAPADPALLAEVLKCPHLPEGCRSRRAAWSQAAGLHSAGCRPQCLHISRLTGWFDVGAQHCARAGVLDWCVLCLHGSVYRSTAPQDAAPRACVWAESHLLLVARRGRLHEGRAARCTGQGRRHLPAPLRRGSCCLGSDGSCGSGAAVLQVLLSCWASSHVLPGQCWGEVAVNLDVKALSRAAGCVLHTQIFNVVLPAMVLRRPSRPIGYRSAVGSSAHQRRLQKCDQQQGEWDPCTS